MKEQFIKRGWFPIPLQGKIPIGKWRDYTHEQIEDLLWGGNWGLDCGKSGLVVMDADSREGLEYCLEVCAPTGTIVETPRGGRHLYYAAPEGIVVGNRQRIMGLGLDRRAHGGLVAAPGAVGENGKPYRLLSDEGLTEYDPAWFAEPETSPIPESEPEPDEIWSDKRLRSYVSKILSISGQGGDTAAFKAACFLVKHRPPDVAWEELLIWNSYCARPAWSEQRLRYKLEQALSHSR